MTSHSSSLRGACLGTVAGAVVSLSTAFAQQSGQKPEVITVTAPWVVTKEVVSQTPAGGKVEQISLTRHVYYGDLDLAKHADVMTLEKRIGDIAEESCDQLAKMYPISGPNPPSCVDKAAASAKAQIEKLTVAAGATHH